MNAYEVGGGQQQDDRLSQLEVENALLRYKVAYYERALEAARVALESAARLATAAS